MGLDLYISKESTSSNLSGLILRNLMLGMLLTLLAFAIRASGLRNVNLRRMKSATGHKMKFEELLFRKSYRVLNESHSRMTALNWNIELQDIKDGSLP